MWCSLQTITQVICKIVRVESMQILFNKAYFCRFLSEDVCDQNQQDNEAKVTLLQADICNLSMW